MDGCWELIELATNKKRADGIICIVIELDWMRGVRERRLAFINKEFLLLVDFHNILRSVFLLG